MIAVVKNKEHVLTKRRQDTDKTIKQNKTTTKNPLRSFNRDVFIMNKI